MPSKSAKIPARTEPTDSQQVYRSEGHRQLTLVDATLAEIGLAVGTTKQSVHDWRKGKKVPEPRARAALWSAYRIPVAAWAQLPRGVEAATAPEGDPARSSAVTIKTAVPSTLDDCIALLNVVRGSRNRPDLLTTERVRLADTECKLLALKHRLEREADLLEHRIVREHPAFQRVKKELARVLAAYPDAARAVAEALARLDL